ncbi:MAG: glutathione S-transferase family protein [Myxococcales bacterium]
MITLYDFELSGSCYKIRLLLNILDVPYKKVNVDFVNKEHRTEKYAKLNPFGSIPIFEDDGVLLRDSAAMLVYLAKKHDKKNYWYPDDPVSMAHIQEWMATGGSDIMNSAAARLVKILNYQLDLESLQTKAKATFKIMDAHLANHQFLALDHPTIADIACFPYTAMAGEGGIDLAPYPNILRWIERMKRVPRFVPMPGIPAAA